ncbi:hypothetical protein KM043_012751 [Ampulex compressa]|nr:hypothetical protein KM043_012751 [Ampulex compressa]
MHRCTETNNSYESIAGLEEEIPEAAAIKGIKNRRFGAENRGGRSTSTSIVENNAENRRLHRRGFSHVLRENRADPGEIEIHVRRRAELILNQMSRNVKYAATLILNRVRRNAKSDRNGGGKTGRNSTRDAFEIKRRAGEKRHRDENLLTVQSLQKNDR